jgi:hypothetical protein
LSGAAWIEVQAVRFGGCLGGAFAGTADRFC